MLVSNESLKGLTVTAADGKTVGQISAMSIESTTWRVESLQVKLAKSAADLLGADHSLFHAGVLDMPVHMVQSVGDTVVLTVPIDRLRQALPPEAIEVKETRGSRPNDDAHA